VTYSIRYDLIRQERIYRPEDGAALATRRKLADSIKAYPWADHLGPFFARVSVAAIKKEIPSAFRFEYGREEPAPEVLSRISSHIDDIVQGLRGS
jgi:hypothetical protein